MEDKDFAVRYLMEHRKGLLEKREGLFRPVRELDQEIEHVDATLRSIQKTQGPQSTLSFPKEELFPVAKLRKLTQVQALTVIAKHYGGTFKAQEAKRILIRAGVMRETKNSTNIIHAVILRSDKFERVGPGEYRLKDANVTPNSATLETVVRVGQSLSKPVQ